MTTEKTTTKSMAKISCPMLNIMYIQISYSVKIKIRSIEFTYLTLSIGISTFMVVDKFIQHFPTHFIFLRKANLIV